MPELPDVEVFRRYLDSTSLHQHIGAVETLDEDILVGISSGQLQRKLERHEFKGTHRHGKYLFGRVKDSLWLVLHFGMTGYLQYYRNRDSAPRHTRLLIDFCNGSHLAYVCQRRLGEVSVADDVERFVAERGLGPDAFRARLGFDAFRERVARGRGSIKSALMDQGKVAGLGNIYSDEVLFQACVHPKAKANKLSDDDLKRLFEAMTEVLETAIEAKADPRAMPSTYVLPHRQKEGACPRCGGTVCHDKVSGRTAYYCPRCQGSA